MNIPLIIPPIIITIKDRLGNASKNIFNACMKVGLSALFLYPLFLAIKKATIIIPNPHNIPGIYPAMNNAATDVPPLTREYIIKELLGGINKPVGADAIFTAALKSLSYPASSCSGDIVPPIAAAAAVPDPLIAPNNIFPTTFVCARDPGNFPDNSVAKLTNFMAIPPLFIIIPASTKNGIANSENEFIPVNIRCAAVNTAFSHGSAVNIDNTEDIPIVTEIGIPISSNTGNTANKINPVLNANSIMFPLNLVYFMQFYFYFLLLLHHLLFF